MSAGLDGRVALVTGGGRGIGAATARTLAARGVAVAVNDINSDAAAATVGQIKAAGGRALALAADIADAEAARGLVTATVEQLGGLSILVNNAAIGLRGALVDYELADWNRVFAVNLTAPFVLSQAAITPLEASGHGSIVNICSVAVIGWEGQVAYDASKGGLQSLTRSLAVELGKRGIRANAICPGFIDTSIADKGELKAIGDKVTAGLPLARMGEPENIADAVAWLACDEARYVTGQSLFVDGGWVRG